MINTSINTHHRWLKAILRFSDYGLTSQIINIERLPEEDQGRRHRIISPSEFRAIIDSAPYQEIRDIELCLRFTGLRISTLLLLQKPFISLQEEIIMIPREINKGKVHGYTIPIDGRIFNIIEKHMINDHYEMPRIRRGKRGPYFGSMNIDKALPLEQTRQFLFPGAALFGISHYYEHIRKCFSQACEDNEILDARIHDLRRTLATELFKASGDLLAVSKMLGHLSPVTTEIYIGLEREDIQPCFEPVSIPYSQKYLELLQMQ